MLSLVLVSLGVLLATALLVRRLLGIVRGRWTTTWLAVLIGQAATIGILQVVTGDVLALEPKSFSVGLALVPVLSMTALALMELLTRTRTRPRTLRVPHPIAAVRGTTERGSRYLQVSAIAVRRGLFSPGGDDSEVSGSRLGRSLAATMEEAGGLFVKLGQAMASQPQLVSPAVATPLMRLQEQAVPADPGAAMLVLLEDVGPPEEIFAAFDSEPVAAASIGQTYFATLRNGRDVVVKVQRPGIRRSMERDLDILGRLAERLDQRTAWARSLGLKELTAGFAEATREELDFRREADNNRAARAALRPGDPITVPEIMEEFTTRRVLVQERVPGRSVGSTGVFNGIDAAARTTLADGLLLLMMRQMISGERFHADPHPGNVFLREDGRLALIDFGSVGRLNRFERAGLVDIFRALQTEDPSLLRQAALRIGASTTRIDTDAMDRELARLLARAMRSDGTLDTSVFGDAVLVFRDFGIQLPRSTTVLFRTLVTTLGTLDVVAPGYDVTDAISRLGRDLMEPLLGGSVTERLQQEAMSLGPVLARLPRDVDDVARSLLRGELRTRVSLFSEEQDVTFVRSMVNRVVTASIGAALALASAILLTVDASQGSYLLLVPIIGGVGLAFAALLMLRIVVDVLRERT